MTEMKSNAKRKFHCACAMGDLSAIEPVTTAKPDGSEPSKPPAAVAAAADKQKPGG